MATASPLQYEAALALVPDFLVDTPQGQQLAQLPAAEVAQVLVFFDRLGRDASVQQAVAQVATAESLVVLAAEVGAPISQAAAEVITAEVELLDDDQLDQVTGGSAMGLAIAGLTLAAGVAYLGAATFEWVASRHDLEAAKINAGLPTA